MFRQGMGTDCRLVSTLRETKPWEISLSLGWRSGEGTRRPPMWTGFYSGLNAKCEWS